ncbi:lamin tail domain-containing protein [Candidatus Nanohalococcus occultus]|uniref:Endonuclease YncB, thermonuclease family n=1 Tax=Candidatus Nanohalococcus occultus TaxID=2978047 RepID=A0ABY8CFR2_9ARCH|nr:Endonuclease YncB, thermonuclease family [Candidatus Nanohaloarchaeota archaeon SVXNc]
MTSVVQAAAAASVLVGLVSIPAVSKTAVEPSAMSAEMPNISDNSTTSEVSKTVSTDGFRAQVQTAFTEFTTNVRPEEANATVQSAASRLQVEKQAGKTVWKLSTSTGSMKLVQTPQKVLEEVETPSGTLRKVRAGGTVSTSFEGADREAVESARQDLKELLEKKKAEIDRKREKFGEGSSTVSSSLELRANESTGSGYGNNTREHVVLVNNGESVDLEGWELGNNNPEFAELGDVTVSNGESVRIYSSDIDTDGITDTGLTWENGGDTAKLRNPDGELVAEKSY